MSITFRGKHASSVAGGLLINSVERGLLPALKARLVRVAGKKGAHDFGSDTDIRSFNIKATVTANSVYELEDKFEEVQEWLDGEEVGELVFDNRPHVSYQAKLDGATSIDPLGTSAFITFTLICPDPVGVGVEHTFELAPSEETIEVETLGNEKAYPVTVIEFNGSQESVTLTDGDSHILIGKPSNLTKETLPSEEIVLWGEVTNPSMLTAATTVDDGIITGEFTTNGFSMRQLEGSYGEWDGVSGWRGASGVQSLKVPPLQDFRVFSQIGFGNAGSWEAAGRIEIYLIDENGLHMGNITIADYYSHIDMPTAEARVGNADTGIRFLNEVIKYPVSDYYMEIARRGREWYCLFGAREGWDKPFYWAIDRRLYTEDRFYTPKLAAIQFHIGTYKNYPAYTAWFGTTGVAKVNRGWGIDEGVDANDVAFKEKDVLIVDNEAAAVYLNGKPAVHLVDPSSKFFGIKKGTTTLGITPTTSILSAEVKVKDRYK